MNLGFQALKEGIETSFRLAGSDIRGSFFSLAISLGWLKRPPGGYSRRMPNKIQRSAWLSARTALPYLLFLLCLMIFFSGLNELLAYERFGSYPLLKLISAHFTHMSFAHLFVNLAALLVIYYLFIEDLAVVLQLLLLGFVSLVVGLGIHYLTDVQRYLGFSGVCHGFLMAGALLTLDRKDRWINVVVIVGTLVKLVEEWWRGDRTTPLFEDGYVAIEAHQLGVAGAFAFALIYYLVRGASAGSKTTA